METQEKIVDVNVDGTFVVKTDAGELCRLCANTDNQFIPIFQGEGLEHNLSLKIERHLPIIKVTETDKLPLQICYQCASTLISWHNLYESCRVADKRLREIIAVDEKLYQEDDSCGDFADDFRDDYDDDTPVHLPTETPSTSNLESNAFKDNPTEIPTLSETKSLINETELEESDERSGWNRHNVITSPSSSHSSDHPSPSDMLVSPDCSNTIEKYSCIGIKLEPRTHDWESSYLSRSTLSNGSSAEDDVTSEDDETQRNVYDSDDDDELSIQTMSAETSSRRDRRFKCGKCRKTFVRRATYWRHLAEKHNRVNIADVEPNEAVRKIVEATSTLKVKLECAEDDQNVESDDRITDDAMKSSDKQDCELFCNTCAKSYPTSQKLKRHIRQVHGNKSKVHQNLKDFCSKFAISDGFLLCDMCSFRCNQFRRHRFMEHYRIHNGEKPHKCGVCGRACRTTSILNKHIRTVHFDCKLYVCDVCGKSFSERRNMEEHFRIHTGDKPFVCDLCGSRFTQQSSLVSHKKSHENRRSYQCDICKATFNTNSVMVRHIRNTHSKEKPHRCDQCDKGFSDKDLLNRHKTVHSQETPFSCKICGARFKLKRYLQQHDRIHQRRA